MRSKHRLGQCGFTLVENAMVAAIISVTVGFAAPSMDQVRSRVHLRGVAAQLETDLQLARSTAVALNRVVQISFDQSAAGSCYVLHTGQPDDCRCDSNGAAVCTGDTEVLRVARVASHDGVRLTSNSRNIGFEPLRGMVTPTATIVAQSRSSEQIDVVVNIMGRVRTCSPTPALDGYPRC